MAKNSFQRPRGTQDILPSDQPWWNLVRDIFRRVSEQAGYERISTPMFEATQLFSRGVGESTEVVSKEMYSFEDRSGNSLTLKPESTAGVVRAYIENGMASLPKPVRLYYFEPAFRYERPQAGRFRQHHQMSVEVFGNSEAQCDVEVIALAARFYYQAGVNYSLQINTIGDSADRSRYIEALRSYFVKYSAELPELAKKQLATNPLRILDSKDPYVTGLCEDAPQLLEYLGTDATEHFQQVLSYLDELGIEYEINPRLVRGLDYYNRTVFEFKGTHEGMQDSIGAGGRYDGLVELLGGQPTPAVGFSLGMERVIQELKLKDDTPADPAPDVFIVALGQEQQHDAFVLSQRLLDEGFAVAMSPKSKDGMSTQLARATKLDAHMAVIIGQVEADAKTVLLKNLRDGGQVHISASELVAQLRKQTA